MALICCESIWFYKKKRSSLFLNNFYLVNLLPMSVFLAQKELNFDFFHGLVASQTDPLYAM